MLRVPVDAREMHGAASLQPNLGVRIFLVHIGLAGDSGGDKLVAGRQGDRVLALAAQKDRITGDPSTLNTFTESLGRARGG